MASCWQIFFGKTNKILSRANRTLNNFSVVKARSVDYSRTSINGHLSTTDIFFGGQCIHSLLFQPLYNGHFLLSPRWPLQRGSTAFSFFFASESLFGFVVICPFIEGTRRNITLSCSRVRKQGREQSVQFESPSLHGNGLQLFPLLGMVEPPTRILLVIFRPIWQKCLLDILYQ